MHILNAILAIAKLLGEQIEQDVNPHNNFPCQLDFKYDWVKYQKWTVMLWLVL